MADLAGVSFSDDKIFCVLYNDAEPGRGCSEHVRGVFRRNSLEIVDLLLPRDLAAAEIDSSEARRMLARSRSKRVR